MIDLYPMYFYIGVSGSYAPYFARKQHLCTDRADANLKTRRRLR